MSFLLIEKIDSFTLRLSLRNEFAIFSVCASGQISWRPSVWWMRRWRLCCSVNMSSFSNCLMIRFRKSPSMWLRKTLIDFLCKTFPWRRLCRCWGLRDRDAGDEISWRRAMSWKQIVMWHFGSSDHCASMLGYLVIHVYTQKLGRLSWCV